MFNFFFLNYISYLKEIMNILYYGHFITKLYRVINLKQSMKNGKTDKFCINNNLIYFLHFNISPSIYPICKNFSDYENPFFLKFSWFEKISKVKKLIESWRLLDIILLRILFSYFKLLGNLKAGFVFRDIVKR